MGDAEDHNGTRHDNPPVLLGEVDIPEPAWEVPPEGCDDVVRPAAAGEADEPVDGEEPPRMGNRDWPQARIGALLHAAVGVYA